MMPTRKPCDDAFERDERAFQKAAEKLQGVAMVCVRQAGSDLARACTLFRDNKIRHFGLVLSENLHSRENFAIANIQETCHMFAASRRESIRPGNPSPEDLIVIAAMNLEDACADLRAPGTTDLPEVGPATIRSRAASAELLEHR
jgi:hypothetical protein